jgi:hypothetical protein
LAWIVARIVIPSQVLFHSRAIILGRKEKTIQDAKDNQKERSRRQEPHQLIPRLEVAEVNLREMSCHHRQQALLTTTIILKEYLGYSPKNTYQTKTNCWLLVDWKYETKILPMKAAIWIWF